MSDSEGKEKLFTCPLCGFHFKHSDEQCHACPLAVGGKCNVICCPNCGYSFSDESRVVEWLKKKIGRKSADDDWRKK